MPRPIIGCLAAVALAAHPLSATTVKIVAAENFYGDVAQKIAGPDAQVTSIMDNPNQDPHEFQTDAKTARAVDDADIVIYSGVGYDDWMEKLLGSKGQKGRTVIRVSDLIGAKAGDNPHIWYDPKTMPALAAKLAEILHKPAEATAFNASLQPLRDKIAVLRRRCLHVKATATEPVFGYMAAALGFDMLNYDYQVAVMNDTDPSFRQTAEFENSLNSKTVKILFYNSQVTDPSTERLRNLAKSRQIPVVGVTETQPPDAGSYVAWMLAELAAVQAALE